jgi:hypothetical protein
MLRSRILMRGAIGVAGSVAKLYGMFVPALAIYILRRGPVVFAKLAFPAG